jgi:hypothetical protein
MVQPRKDINVHSIVAGDTVGKHGSFSARRLRRDFGVRWLDTALPLAFFFSPEHVQKQKPKAKRCQAAALQRLAATGGMQELFHIYRICKLCWL